MTRTPELELPNGDVVAPEDVFLYENYPYRYRPLGPEATHEFVFSPLYWGDSGMDVPFPDRGALVEQWGERSRGTLTAAEWAEWLDRARADDRFDDDEVATLARELPAATGANPGLFERLRAALGR
ncbi:MAG: hypothetical protein ABEJ79_12530 [Halolamina sp.]